MAILRLFDVSQFIASGMRDNRYIARGFEEVAGNCIPREIPVGGVTYLFEEIRKFMNEETDIVLCFDKTPTIKREIFSKAYPYSLGYKGHRPKKEDSTLFQRELAEEMCKLCGFNTLSLYGYEADDLIASVVKYYKDSYEKVYIHSRDSDLFYLVDYNVECVPVGRTGKYVTRSNWSDTVVTGWTIPYNMLTLHKMLQGEPGDNIPRVAESILDPVYDAIPEKDWPLCGDNDFLRKVIHEVTHSNPEAIAVMELIMPLILEEREVSLFDEHIDVGLFTYFLQQLGLVQVSVYAATSNIVGNQLIEKYVERYINR